MQLSISFSFMLLVIGYVEKLLSLTKVHITGYLDTGTKMALGGRRERRARREGMKDMGKLEHSMNNCV